MFSLYERVQDNFDGRIGRIIKILYRNSIFLYRVKFNNGNIEDFEASWLKKIKAI